jgi:peptidoglycan/xylan/chitin deacetylase (PgdA/CDA1 family)
MFRPPFGVTNPPLCDALKQKGYKVIGWSLRSRDTVISDEEKLLARIKARIRPGDVILLHDSLSQTASVTGKLIKFAKEQGYSFERPDKLLGIEAYEKV